jgi:hypothetical protein
VCPKFVGAAAEYAVRNSPAKKCHPPSGTNRGRRQMTFARDETVVILGSSRSNGNTRGTLRGVLEGMDVELSDLSELRIGTYDYQHLNASDDFSRSSNDYWPSRSGSWPRPITGTP